MTFVSPDPSASVRSQRGSDALAEAVRSGRPFLLYHDGDGREQVFPLASEVASVTVGRRSSADLPLAWDHKVSRLHARIEAVPGGWELVDDGLSSNGTFVNDERLSGRRRLIDGDTMGFGATAVTFRHPAREPARDSRAIDLSMNQRRVLVALCRPYKGNRFANPASDEEIAEELVVAEGEVRGHLQVICAKLGIDGPRQAEMRVRIVEWAFSTGTVSEREL
jgi:hypothetical protein